MNKSGIRWKHVADATQLHRRSHLVWHTYKESPLIKGSTQDALEDKDKIPRINHPVKDKLERLTGGVGRPHLSAIWSYPLHAGWHMDPRPYPLVHLPWRPCLLCDVGPLCKGVTPVAIFCGVVWCLRRVFFLFCSCSYEIVQNSK